MQKIILIIKKRKSKLENICTNTNRDREVRIGNETSSLIKILEPIAWFKIHFCKITFRSNLPKQDKCGCLDTGNVMLLKPGI